MPLTAHMQEWRKLLWDVRYEEWDGVLLESINIWTAEVRDSEKKQGVGQSNPSRAMCSSLLNKLGLHGASDSDWNWFRSPNCIKMLRIESTGQNWMEFYLVSQR